MKGDRPLSQERGFRKRDYHAKTSHQYCCCLSPHLVSSEQHLPATLAPPRCRRLSRPLRRQDSPLNRRGSHRKITSHSRQNQKQVLQGLSLSPLVDHPVLRSSRGKAKSEQDKLWKRLQPSFQGLDRQRIIAYLLPQMARRTAARTAAKRKTRSRE